MNDENILLKIDKKYTSFLLKAISAVIDDAKKRNIDITNHYISFEKIISRESNREMYLIRFYAIEVTDDNWMDLSASHLKEIDVTMDVNTEEIISIYGSR
jgi:phosphomevalonate kinase